ncbi:MAG: FG-GAP-like repeat-containing protein [Pseudomonadota bacterium]
MRNKFDKRFSGWCQCDKEHRTAAANRGNYWLNVNKLQRILLYDTLRRLSENYVRRHTPCYGKGGLDLKAEVRKLLFVVVLLLSVVAIAAAAAEPSRVVIIPFKMNADRDLSFLKEGIVDMLASRLSSGETVAVVSRQETDQALEDISEPVNEEIARAIGERLQADYVLFGSLTLFGNSVSLDAKMVDVGKKRPTLAFFKQGGQVDEVIPRINLLAAEINETFFGRPAAASRPASPEVPTDQAKVWSAKPAPAAAPGFAKSVVTAPADIAQGGLWKSQNFKIAIKGLALGDVNGDGKTEVVFISDQQIYVYRFENQRLVKIWEKAGKGDDRLISVDAADINGNGRAEIFVTSVKATGQRLGSFVLEWDNGDFRRVSEDSPWYYRVIDTPGRGSALFGQKRRMDEPFAPGIYELTWRDGEYTPGDRITLPKRTNIFGFAFGDVMNNGRQMVIVFDSEDHIRIFDPSGEEEFSTDERYGGSMNYVEYWSKNEDTPERLYLPQRISVRDLDGDGRPEVVTASNEGALGRLFKKFRRFEGGRMVSLSWKSLGLMPDRETRKISGHISDFAVGDFDNDGSDELVAVHVAKQGTAVTGAKSSIIAYEIGQAGPAQ